nr:hypothetical protein [Tanacetum cinerariifolium]
MATVTTMESLQESVNELKNAILEIKEGMNGFLVSQNAISNELNRMKNGEATSNNGGNHNHRTGGRGYGRMSKIEMELVSMHVYDKALIWHQQFCIRFGENCPWELYEKEVLKRFGTVLEDPLMELKKLKQEGTVKDYQEKFEELLNIVELDEKHAISLFLGGLKNEISMQIRMFTLDSLTDVFYMAKMQEQTLVALKARYTPLLPNPASKLNISNSQGVRNVNGNAKPNTSSGILSKNKHSTRQLFSLVVLPDEEFEENSEEETEENRVGEEFEVVQPQISLNALTGTNNFQTMRVLGTVGKHVVHILVDCGSTHNFLDKNVAQKLGCPIRPTVPLAVTVADGNNLLTTSECKNFKWKFGNNEFSTDVMLLPLGGCDMIQGKRVAIRGTHKSTMEWMNDKGTDKNVVQAEFHSMALCVFPANAASCMQLEGALPVNIRPYWHPPTQKDAIESMVKELLEADVIKKSRSPFASPIVMVKKKDSSWRMCVDYRQLNKQTIKDKFPIPVIEELIDERFIKGYAIVSRPLTQLLKKGAFVWSDSAQIAFEALKQAMTSAPVLRLPDFNKEFAVETDASGWYWSSVASGGSPNSLPKLNIVKHCLPNTK